MNIWYTTLSLHLLQSNANIYTTPVLHVELLNVQAAKLWLVQEQKWVLITFLVLPLKPLDTNSTHKTSMSSFNIEIPTQSDNIFGGLSWRRHVCSFHKTTVGSGELWESLLYFFISVLFSCSNIKSTYKLIGIKFKQKF